ncbi:MAG: hypothetical protein K8S24_06345 [Candidatus Aegiribacteria sp.]|nr:hypothetical protein [Candidatus Aegiribacteria sp.]
MSDTFTGETYNTLCNDAEGYLTKESPEQARELLQKAISLIGTRPRARSLLADTCMSMELWSEARSQLEILITLDEGNTINNFRLAQVLEELGEYQLAQDNYSVVLDVEPDHHGAKVAVKRIETRSKDSGVNLAGIFNAPPGNVSGETDTDDDADKFKDGLQVFPDVPSDEIFADSESDEDDSVERLLKNIGLSGDSTEEEEDDVSVLLENIGVSTSQTLQSAFDDSEGSQDDSEDTGDAKAEKKQAVTSLDEIFGTSSVAEEEELEVEPEVEKSEEDEGDHSFSSEPAEKDETEPYPFSSNNTLEAIFNAPESENDEAETEPETEESGEEEIELEVEKPGKEEIELEVEEPEVKETKLEVEKPGKEEIELEVEEPEVKETKLEVEKPGKEEIEPEVKEPEVKKTVKEIKKKLTAVLKQKAKLSFDPWSTESGLLTVHMKSGIVRVKQSMLPIYEKSIKVGLPDDGMLELSGKGTFLLNCGSQEPLIVELKKNMVIRKDAVAFHTGTINIELLDIPENDLLYVIKEKNHEKVVFRTDSPTRVILLGGNKRVFYVRTSSIMATDPEILLSHSESPEGYTEITGHGKVYLIE